ncbi:sulfotransferase domain-containing protein [Nocardia gipuzkoensis]
MQEAAALDPIALHQSNIDQLGEDDVIVASYPGAGAALLGNALLELGLDYFDPYTQRLTSTGTTAAEPQRLEYRRRLAASAARDNGSGGLRTQGGIRFVKTHLLPEAFERVGCRRVAVLVRDPRDTLFSYYNWRLGFSEEGETRTFAGFLQEPNLFGRRPVEDWTRFHASWRKSATHSISFERMKTNPAQAVGECITAFGMTRTAAELARAMEQSSFEAMRRHEDGVATDSIHRLMRRGLVGEWAEWYHGDIVDYFQDPAFQLMAADLGYRL